MEAALDGICELVLESRAPEEMVDFYERLGLRPRSREPGRVWLRVGSRSRLRIWTPGDKEHRDRGETHVHFALSTISGQLEKTIASTRPDRHRSGDDEGLVDATAGIRPA
jgi:catechol-2,3-dioxygenase